MKKILLYSAMFFCLVMAAYKLIFYFDYKSEKKGILQNKSKTRLTPDEFSLIKEGDFILRRGFGFFSDYIAQNLNSGSIDVTHAGIIVMKNNKLYVIHSLSSDVSAVDGVQIQSLTDFLQYSEPYRIIITRTKGADVRLGGKIARLAESYLNKKIPFDHQGIFDDDKEFFCTELIWKILEKDLNHTKLPATIEERKKLFLSMDAMYDTSYFEILINQYKN